MQSIINIWLPYHIALHVQSPPFCCFHWNKFIKTIVYCNCLLTIMLTDCWAWIINFTNTNSKPLSPVYIASRFICIRILYKYCHRMATGDIKYAMGRVLPFSTYIYSILYMITGIIYTPSSFVIICIHETLWMTLWPIHRIFP